MKKILFLIVPLSLCSSLVSQTNDNHTNIVANLINSGRWIDTKEYIELYGNEMDELMLLMGTSLVDAFTNKPEEAIENLNELLTKYGDQLGLQSLQFYALLLNIYDDRQMFDKSVKLCDDMLKLDILSPEIREGTQQRKEWCMQQSKQPKLEVKKYGEESSISYVTGENSNAILFNVNYNGSDLKATFDTGFTASTLTEEIANQVGVKYYSDKTFDFNNTAIKVKMGTIDSIKIGNYVIYNFPVAILPSILDSTPDFYRENEKFQKAKKILLDQSKVILGMSLLKLIEEIQIDAKNKTVNFPLSSTHIENANPMQLVDNRLYAKIFVNDCNFTGFWDTGQNWSLLINNTFYDRNSHLFSLENVSDTIQNFLLASGVETLSGKRPSNIEIKVSDKIYNTSHALILDTNPTNYGMTGNLMRGYDGILGDFMLGESDLVIFNFKNMWFYCK